MRSRRKSRNFYRIILSDNQSSLEIPKRFTREHRKQILLNNVLLIVDDKVWPLDWMISDDGQLWLQRGWPEFVQHYCFGVGHFLLFNHLGKSVFHVSIYDRSCCEINYQIPSKSPKSGKWKDRSVIQEMEVDSDLAWEKGKEHSSRSRKRAVESAKSFRSDNPFYSVKIKPTYTRSWGMYVPFQFLRRYLSGDVNCVLETSGGGHWGPIECSKYKTYGRLYGANWTKFHDENHLGVGDVCVFELMNEIEKVLKVTIFRAWG